MHHNELVGFGIIENHTGDIPQLSVHPNYRRQGIATALLQALVKFSEKEKVKIINIPDQYLPFKGLFQSLKIESGKGQFEMVRKL